MSSKMFCLIEADIVIVYETTTLFLQDTPFIAIMSWKYRFN